MAIIRFHCPFVGLSGCHDGSGNALTKTSLITHLRGRHFNGDALAITKHSLATSLVVFEEADVTLKRMGHWLCGICFRTHTFRSKCRHGNGSNIVSPPDCGDGVVRFVLYDLTRPQVTSSVQLAQVEDLVLDEYGGFDLPLLDTLLSKGLRIEVINEDDELLKGLQAEWGLLDLSQLHILNTFVSSGDAVVDIYTSYQKMYALLEMRSVEETQQCSGSGRHFIKVRRPVDYNSIQAAIIRLSLPNPKLNLRVVGLTPGSRIYYSTGSLEGPDCLFVGGLPCYVTEPDQ
ncbi:splicing factor U2af large subunit B [Artemisia annua]|uniref:Splicing factor U2af large subunit B n=1 Tax=Artemisia annua TaxID=35608 RepID=A0A2U1MH43_ARTAN|nr:splicing factor U2af large subunit B [Artemisia annua]